MLRGNQSINIKQIIDGWIFFTFFSPVYQFTISTLIMRIVIKLYTMCHAPLIYLIVERKKVRSLIHVPILGIVFFFFSRLSVYNIHSYNAYRY